MRKFTLSTVMMLAAAATFTLSSCGDPYYDEEFYAEGHYEEDYDDDGYRLDRREDRGRHHGRAGERLGFRRPL